MRLAKSLKLMFGIAVSTVMGLVLSGGAFAADGGEGTTSQQNVSQVVQTAESGSAVVENASSANYVATVNGGSGGGQSNSSTGVSPVANAGTQAPGAAQTPSETSAAKTSSASLLVTSPSQSDLSVIPSETGDKPRDQGVVAAQAADSAANSDNDGIAQVVPMGEMVVFHSARLAIQPKITSTTIQGYDLASTIPSAPAQKQNPSSTPTPTTSNSLLGNLTARLAGSVVPALFITPNLSLSGLAILFLILAATLYLAAGLDVDIFGSWTRRGGYAHAARSDVPSAIINTFFATPLRLGYVSAFTPQHSPILLVSEIKQYYRWFPMLIERRK